MKYRIKDYTDIRATVDAYSTEELLLAILCPNYTVGRNAPRGDESSAFIHPTTAELAKKTITSANDGRSDKTLMASDFEFGTGKMIRGTPAFPSLMALSVNKDPELAYQMGYHTARQAIAVGYNWTFSPCIDILANPRNPIVGSRTSGTTAEDVITYSGAYMRGMKDGGLFTTLKHFPGDGFSDCDQHLTTTENPLSRQEWDATVGKAYSELIEQGAEAVMPGHISLPAYDEIDPETGLYPPATVSKNLLTGLLREKLGFEGLIASDAVNMSGFCGYMNMYRASARFLEAGGDCVVFMHPTEEYFTEMKKLIECGELTLETLRDRAYRVKCFAREAFERGNAAVGKVDIKAMHECCETVTRGAIEIVRDRKSTLPMDVKKGTKIAHIILCNPGCGYNENNAPAELTAELKARGAEVDSFVDPGPDAFCDAIKTGKYDYIICSVVNAMCYGLNSVKLCGTVARNLMCGWMRYGTPAVFVSYFDQFFERDWVAVSDAVVNTYGMGTYTAKALADKICK